MQQRIQRGDHLQHGGNLRAVALANLGQQQAGALAAEIGIPGGQPQRIGASGQRQSGGDQAG